MPIAGGQQSSRRGWVDSLIGMMRPTSTGDIASSVFPMVGMASSAAKTIVPRMWRQEGGAAARQVAQAASEASPNLMKWVMDRGGKVRFAPAGTYHETMVEPSRRLAGGVIDSGRVNVYRDLTRAGEGGWNSIKQAVAQALKEAGY